MDIFVKIVIIGFFLSPILDIIAFNKMRKYKKENADLRSEILRKEYDEECR